MYFLGFYLISNNSGHFAPLSGATFLYQFFIRDETESALVCLNDLFHYL